MKIIKLRLINMFVNKKNKLIILCFLFVLFSFSLLLINNFSNKTISKQQAVSIVKNLPEVKTYLKMLNNVKAGFFVNAEERVGENNYLHVQVAEVVVDSKIGEEYISHTATFNWYKVDKTSGKIICSMFLYDKNGKYLGSNEKPCP
ncbi:MAG: hypothetical protein Q7K55_05425 [Candidatus Levybacteria bacterium]|nr:hypothetical protein [Candidatus Levybacteria bacterium]